MMIYIKKQTPSKKQDAPSKIIHTFPGSLVAGDIISHLCQFATKSVPYILLYHVTFTKIIMSENVLLQYKKSCFIISALILTPIYSIGG